MNRKPLLKHAIANKSQFLLSRVLQILSILVCCAIFATSTFAQTTASGTQIVNQASATYSDGTNTFTTVSNTVTVTVAQVSGLTITPDGTSLASVASGQQNVLYTFVVTNTGNFSDQVRFLANGQSMQITGAGSILSAVIDLNKNGVIDAGETDIFTNSSDVISANIAQNGNINVIVSVSINNNAAPGSVITVQLGDTTTGSPTFDNQAANSSAREVRTVTAASVNGLREARGDLSATVENDAQLVLSLSAPAGPVNAATLTTPGSNINYTWQLCNTGMRSANAVTLTNAPAGSNTGVFIIAPIPVGTILAMGQTFPAGTLFSTSPLTTSPLTATYTTTAPTDLTSVRRVAFRTGPTLAVGCSASFAMQVTVTTMIITNDIYEIGDAFATNSVNTPLTDQSGDTVPNKGDGNANFDEPIQGGAVSPTQGFQQVTTLMRLGSVLIGPQNAPSAVGPTSNNDDYTNRSVTTGIAGLGFGSTTSAAGTIEFLNTIRNTGNANDTYTVTIPNAPAGFTVEVSLDGTTYTPMTSADSVSVPVNAGADRTIRVRVTAPVGTAVLAENGFPVTVRATSTLTASASNETINRLYTGFLRMTKSYTVINGTGVGSPTEAVPGAVIEYTIDYRNLSSSGGGAGTVSLIVTNLVITENGNVAPNNWGSTTDQVVGSASDTRNGVTTTTGITGDTAGSAVLTNTIPTLAPQASGTFKFRRTIR